MALKNFLCCMSLEIGGLLWGGLSILSAIFRIAKEVYEQHQDPFRNGSSVYARAFAQQMSMCIGKLHSDSSLLAN